MKRIALAVLLVACYNPPTPAPELPPDGLVEPGETYSLKALVTTAAGTNTITWSVVEPDGGVIDQQGHYTAPGCPVLVAPYTPTQLAAAGEISGTAHVLATWAGGSMQITCTVVERFLGVRVDPTSASLDPGGTVTFRGVNSYTCHEAATP